MKIFFACLCELSRMLPVIYCVNMLRVFFCLKKLVRDLTFMRILDFWFAMLGCIAVLIINYHQSSWICNISICAAHIFDHSCVKTKKYQMNFCSPCHKRYIFLSHLYALWRNRLVPSSETNIEFKKGVLAWYSTVVHAFVLQRRFKIIVVF